MQRRNILLGFSPIGTSVILCNLMQIFLNFRGESLLFSIITQIAILQALNRYLLIIFLFIAAF